ncbi:MAG TPA: metallophosphoesterase [Limnochordia bacterium]
MDRGIRSIGWLLLAAWLGNAAPAQALPPADEGAFTPLSGLEWAIARDGRFARAPEALPPAFTLRSTVEMGEDLSGVEAIRLAGVETPEGRIALALVWEPVSSGWFGLAWSLRLKSETGLLASAAAAAELRGAAGSAATVELVRAIPMREHTYAALLSYDAASGAVSIRVADLTDPKPIYEGGLQAAPTNAPLYPIVGLHLADPSAESGPAFRGTGAIPLYLPVGAQWATESLLPGGTPIAAWRFATDETMRVDLTLPDPAPPGIFRLVLAHDGNERELARVPAGQDGWPISLPGSSLPLGPSTLRIEYRVGETVWLEDTREVAVGAITVRAAPVEIDRTGRQLRGSVAIEAPTALEDLGITVRLRLAEQVWDPVRREYAKRPYGGITLAEGAFDLPEEGALSIPFSAPLPQAQGMYSLAFEVSTRPAIAVELLADEQLFTTYAPASLVPGEPFTIAVLPDTQYYAQSYPVIFTRQLQWIASRAAEQNIVLALQLGDITDDNAPYQWERAVSSFGLLEGVMPFMLAQGNHDIGANGAAADRAESLINAYFPPGKLPWVTGTFEPGRIENSYALFHFQGEDYLIISLEFGPRDEVLAWANEVIAAHPDHRVILFTHSYIGRDGSYTDSAERYDLAANPNTTVNGGDEIWRKLVSRHANAFISLSGHVYARTIPRRLSHGLHGNTVYEMLIDYQGDPNGGNGYLALLTFRPDGMIEVQAYSPYLGQGRQDRDGYGFGNHFLIDTVRGRYARVAEQPATIHTGE